MIRKLLTAEEIAQLRSSPYVASVISGRVFFTPEFKEVMYDALLSDKTIREVLEEHGLDPEILGDTRIYSITHTLRAQGARDNGLVDLRVRNSRKPPEQTKEQTLATRVEQLEHKLAYTQQEVEFLKKIHAADLEAREAWGSRQRQK